MLPIPEFHFALYGIATVAATLGYACARRATLSFASPVSPSKPDDEAGPPEERSLKRKLDDSDENEVDTEEQSRPMKRNKTPPTDLYEPDEDFNQEWEVVVAPPPYEEAVGLRQPQESVQDKTLIPVLSTEQVIVPDVKGVETGHCPTPQPPPVDLSPNESVIPPPRPITPPPPAPPAKSAPANAFSAFSASGSPFASYSNSSGASPFAVPGNPVKTTPIWRRNNEIEAESDVFDQASPASTLAPSPNDVLSSLMTESSAISKSKSTLGLFGEAPSLGQSSNYLTGEEDEYVEAELKGVKLFIKRGRKEFTDGMYGHIKLLAQKSAFQKVDNEDLQGSDADTNSRTRLLFRRDPLGQVSMNVGLHPTVRCHFDAAENILRVILMEQVTADGKNAKEDVIVYALKPGRVQKADFQSFSKTLCEHEGLKSKVVSGSGSPGDTTGTAS